MESLPGGYTNLTRRSVRGEVEKRYRGGDGRTRAAVERACLEHLAGIVPVPVVLATDLELPSLVMAVVHGRHGQALIETGHAVAVMRLAGELLRSLQRLDPRVIPELAGSGAVIVHGDFGPQNLLIADSRVSALLDWEFAHRGEPIEDLAWAEWIVRTHHPEAVGALGELHDCADLHFDWSSRHAAMVQRCQDLLVQCERHRLDAAELWHRRLERTEAWTE